MNVFSVGVEPREAGRRSALPLVSPAWRDALRERAHARRRPGARPAPARVRTPRGSERATHAAAGMFRGAAVAVTNARSAPSGPAAARNSVLSEAADAVNVPLKPSSCSALASAPPPAAEPVQKTKSGCEASAAFASSRRSRLPDGHVLQADELRDAVDRADRLLRERLRESRRRVADDREPLRAPVVHPVRGRERLLVERAVQQVRVAEARRDQRRRRSRSVTRNGIPAAVDDRHLARGRVVAGAADDAGDAVVRERPRRGSHRPAASRRRRRRRARRSRPRTPPCVVDLVRREPRAVDEIVAAPEAPPLSGASTPIVSFPLAAVADELPAEQSARRDDHERRPRTTSRRLEPAVKGRR